MLVCACGFGVGGLELVGRSWLVLCWPPLQAMLAHRGGYVGPSWRYVGPA